MDFKTLLIVLVALVGGWAFLSDLGPDEPAGPQLASGTQDGVYAAPATSEQATAPRGPSMLDRFFAVTDAALGGGSMRTSVSLTSDRSDAFSKMRGIVTTPDGQAQELDAVFAEYRPADQRDMPAVLTPVEDAADCTLRLPVEGERVFSLVSAEDLPTVPVYAFDRPSLDYDVEAVLGRAMEGRLDSTRPVRLSGRAAYRVQDVAVTETQAPVYLVLQNWGGDTLWNLSLAPGARLAHVVVLGGEQSGVANLPPETEVDILRGAALAACGGQMSFPPAADAVIHSSVKLGIREAEASLAAWKVRDRQWSAWVEANFGVPAGLQPARKLVHAYVAGPVPGSEGDRAVHAPIAGATAHLARADHLLAGATASEVYPEIIDSYATEIAGVPLADLAPVVFTRGAQ